MSAPGDLEAAGDLEAWGLSKRFGAAVALDGVGFALPAGGRLAVVGPSGSGKTTLLRLLAGFEVPDAGRVRLGGAVLADGGMAVPAHRRDIGIVSQDGALFPHLSVAENVGFGLARRLPGRAARVGALLDTVELGAGFAGRRPHELSGGQQQRVALARALARAPRLMLLDEPFSALDPGLRASLRRATFARLAEGGITAVLVTHDREEALAYADRLAVLDRGRLAGFGPPRALYLRPPDRATALLLGEAVLLPAEVANGVAYCALGALPVDAGGPARGEVMLRHEQLRLAPPAAGEAAAEVTAIEFRGAVSTVALALPGAGPLHLTVPSPDAPAPGARVRVAVAGMAHVLPA